MSFLRVFSVFFFTPNLAPTTTFALFYPITPCLHFLSFHVAFNLCPVVLCFLSALFLSFSSPSSFHFFFDFTCFLLLLFLIHVFFGLLPHACFLFLSNKKEATMAHSNMVNAQPNNDSFRHNPDKVHSRTGDPP